MKDIKTYHELADEAITKAKESLDEDEEPFSWEINELPFGAYEYIQRKAIKEFGELLLANCFNESLSASYERFDIEDIEIIRLAKEHYGVDLLRR